MTPEQQVQMHEHVEDARRVLHGRTTEEGYAFAALLSQMRGAINERLRKGERVGLMPYRVRVACEAVLAGTPDGRIGRSY